MWSDQRGFVEYVDGAVFVVLGVEEYVPFVMFVRLKYNLYKENFRVKSVFGSGIMVTLPFAA